MTTTLNTVATTKTAAPQPWFVAGWSLFPFKTEDGHEGYRAEPDHFERNLPQAIITAAYHAAMVANVVRKSPYFEEAMGGQYE